MVITDCLMCVCMYVFYSASVYKVWYNTDNTGTLLIHIYTYYITQNQCQPTRVYAPYNTYVNGRGGLNLSELNK